jgi:hypothetical protein
MTAARKIIAFLIIVFIGLPTLFAVIWTVGLTKGSVSPEFVSDLPREIIADVPDMADEIFRDAQDERIISDPNIRAWFQAAAKANITPKQVMAEIGLLDWMENELSQALVEVGEVLRGERRPRTIVLDFRPLKTILLREEIDYYILETLKNLPPCDEEGTRKWMRASDQDFGDRDLPACRPDLALAREVLTYNRIEAVNEMEDEIEIFEDVRFFPFSVSRTLTLLSYALFFIPVVFIFIGALVAATSPASFFRWSGASVFLGALPALLIAFFAKQISIWAVKFAPYSFEYNEIGASELGDLVLEKAGWIPLTIIDQLFSPVIIIAGIVCVVGIGLFVISFFARGKVQRVKTSPTPVKTPPEKPAGEPEKIETKPETTGADPERGKPQKPEETPEPEEPKSEPGNSEKP